jgi:hypothetical protein
VRRLYPGDVRRSTLDKDWDSGVGRCQSTGWNTAGGGYLYRTSGSHIFTLSLPRPSNGVATGSTTAKPLALDPVFWDITGMSEVSSKRVGFRVSGVFTVPMVKVKSHGFEFDGDVDKSTNEFVRDLHEDFLAVEPLRRSPVRKLIRVTTVVSRRWVDPLTIFCSTT